jgi:photosystem II stability/assembly factor-like uncharacterized protein
MRGNGYERELKHHLARLPQHKKMPERSKQRILQTLIIEEGKMKRERSWKPLRTKLKWATLTLAAGLILVIGGLSLKDKIISPESGVTQGTHAPDNPLAKIKVKDVQSITVMDGTNGKKENIDDDFRIKGIISTLKGANPKHMNAKAIKGYLYQFHIQSKTGMVNVLFLGDKIKVGNDYYSLDYDVSDKIKSIVQFSPKSEITDNQNTKTTQRDIAISKVADFKMFEDGTGWLWSDGGLAFTNDRGATWKMVTPPIGSNSQEMVMPKLFATGEKAWFAFYSVDEAFVYRTTDGGGHWSKVSFKTEQQMMGVQSIQFSDDNHGYLLLSGDMATGNEMVSVYKTDDGGATWSLLGAMKPGQPSALPYSGMKTSVVFKDDKIGWITGLDHSDQPFLYQSTDGGHTWTQQMIKVPNGYTAEGASSMTYSPIFFNQNDGILPVRFGGEWHPYVFYQTNNGGATWEPTGDSIHTPQGVIDMNNWDFVNQKVGYATSGKQLFVTEDGGNHWTTITLDNEFSKIDFQTKEVGYGVSTHQLFKTIDGGKTWIPVTLFK